MEPVTTALRLLKRQAEIEHRRRQRDSLPVLDERELFAIQRRLDDFSTAVRAIVELSRVWHRLLDQIRVEDVENWDAHG